MKKFAYFILGAMIILAPLTASAIEALNVDTMKATTGQAGVSIAIDDVLLYQDLGDVTYRDNDGTDGTAGAIKITGNDSLLSINAIIDGDETDLQHDYTTGFGTWAASALTIDVGVCPDLTSIYQAGPTSPTDSIGGVLIGLPTIEIYDALASKSQIITFEGAGATYANAGDEFIEILTEGATLAVLGGSIEIAPH